MSLTVRKFVIAIMASALILCLACGVTRGSSERIVFTSDRDGNQEIYSIGTDGEDEKNLTASNADEFAPRLSPHQNSIAFLSENNETETSIDVMRSDGSQRIHITDTGTHNSDPRWSPDSERIVFLSRRGGGSTIILTSKDGSGSTPMTSASADEVGDWSDNGEFVIYTIKEGPLLGIYIRNPDGVNEFRMTNQFDYSPRWSPDSKQVAFLSTRGGNVDLYVMSADGGDLVQITDNSTPEYDISWSPSSEYIAFVSERDGNPEIYSASRNGKAIRRLTFNTSADNQPVWSPEGDRIAFVSFLDGDGDIYVMDADGDNQKRLTNNNAQDKDPDW